MKTEDIIPNMPNVGEIKFSGTKSEKKQSDQNI